MELEQQLTAALQAANDEAQEILASVDQREDLPGKFAAPAEAIMKVVKAQEQAILQIARRLDEFERERHRGARS